MKHLIYLPILMLLTAWTPITESCGPPQAMRCTSAGLVSEARSGAVLVSADVTVEPAADGRFYVALALNGDVAADNRYASAAVVNNITPFIKGGAPTGGPAAVLLADGADHCCTILGRIDPAAGHHLSISYDGQERVTACVDGWCDTVRIDLRAGYVVELLCVGVDPGERGRNPVGCAFTNIAGLDAPAAPAPPARPGHGPRFWEWGPG